jgi:hypothetical protein
MFLLKLLFYGLFIIISLAAAFFLILGLSEGTVQGFTRERILLILSSFSALMMLYFSFRFGHANENWAAGIGFEFLAVFVFLIIMIVGLLTGKIHWQ